jgi:hypothetical protein
MSLTGRIQEFCLSTFCVFVLSALFFGLYNNNQQFLNALHDNQCNLTNVLHHNQYIKRKTFYVLSADVEYIDMDNSYRYNMIIDRYTDQKQLKNKMEMYQNKIVNCKTNDFKAYIEEHDEYIYELLLLFSILFFLIGISMVLILLNHYYYYRYSRRYANYRNPNYRNPNYRNPNYIEWDYNNAY